MCKIVMLFGICFIFCGCNKNEPKPSEINISVDESSENRDRETLDINKYPGCKLLASGYLVCPKSIR